MVTWVLTTIDDGNIVCENLWWYYTEMKYVWIDWLKIVLKMVTNTLGIDMYKNDINHYKNTKHKQHLVKISSWHRGAYTEINILSWPVCCCSQGKIFYVQDLMELEFM